MVESSVGLSLIIYSLVTPAAYAAETATYQYDALCRLKQTAKSGSPAAGTQTSTTYDPAGNRTNQATSGAGGGSTPPPPNTPPVANSDSASVFCEAATIKNLTANDMAADGDCPLALQSIVRTSGGGAFASTTSSTSVQIFADSTNGATYFTYIV